MSQFDRANLDVFLGAVRKYMQMRGGMSQKDLAEITDTGVSTMSRFLNQQTKDLNPQLIAQITAKLNIPLHEIIDFVEEGYTEQFVRLVKFYKGENPNAQMSNEEPPAAQEKPAGDDEDESFVEALDGGAGGGAARKTTTASITSGGRTRNVAFMSEGQRSGDMSVRDKMKNLTARQRAFLNDFLNLDTDGRDLVVDIGKNIISYLRQKGIDF
ncbi:helix-turn-helix transcriptional regulator [Bacteriovoracaceae bacterium]|nr:helix-turn-helix transcriptional regulator [Bacteriovoracaceae bacterium]|tara:strand:+ start:25718 stop:26356 length:639 start_codon:yes stop_codon:yes gene_type:complete